MAGRGKGALIRGVEYQSINDALIFYGLNRNSYTHYKNPNSTPEEVIEKLIARK